MPQSRCSYTKTSAGTAPRAKRGRSRPRRRRWPFPTVSHYQLATSRRVRAQTPCRLMLLPLSATVSALVTEALKTTLLSEILTGILKNSGPPIPLEPLALESPSSVGATLTAEVADILQDGHPSGTSRGGVPTTLNDSPPQSTFASMSVPLSSRVSAKLKAKIFANEYVDFGALLSSSPNDEREIFTFHGPFRGII